MLIYLLLIVILFIFFKKEGFNTYLKYKDIPKDISDKFDTKEATPETDCIYTELPPQIEKVYNVDFDSPFDRYNKSNINSEYNISYYDDDDLLDISFDITKQESDNIFPFYQAYRYCDLSNQEPTCTHLTCGINEEISEIQNIRGRQKINVVSHIKAVADLLNQKQLEVKPNATSELSTKRTNLSNEYNVNDEKSTKYLGSINSNI